MRKDWRVWGPVACLFLAAAGALQCNKTSGINSNKASVLVIHTAQGRPALNVGELDGKGKFGTLIDSALNYGSIHGTIGDTAHPYIYTAVYKDFNVGVKPIEVVYSTDSATVSSGSTTFNYGRKYSMFLFDDSVAATTLPVFLLPDNIISSVDTFAYLRWLNFSPNTYYDFIIDNRRPDSVYTGLIKDTIASGFLNFVGDNEKISSYSFKRVHTGKYRIKVFYDVDSITRLPKDYYQLPDSLFLVRDRSYTAFVQGYIGATGEKKLRLRVIQHN